MKQSTAMTTVDFLWARADFCAGERVIESRVNLSNCPTKHALPLLQFSIHEHQSLAIATKVLTRRSLRREARYRKQGKSFELPNQACFVLTAVFHPWTPVFAHRAWGLYTQILALGSAVHTQIKSVNGLNIEAKRYLVAPNDSFFKWNSKNNCKRPFVLVCWV